MRTQTPRRRRTRRDPDAPLRVVGYTRVSTDEQAAFGISLDAQASRIRQYCQAKADINAAWWMTPTKRPS